MLANICVERMPIDAAIRRRNGKIRQLLIGQIQPTVHKRLSYFLD